MNQRDSMVLVEVVFSVVLFSIVLIYSMNILLSLQSKSKTSLSYTYNNINLESTRLYLQKNNEKDKIRYQDDILFYDNNILLDKVTVFEISLNGAIGDINICIDTINTTCQRWKIVFI